MDSFWTLARRMLDRRAMVALAVVFAFVSAGGLGVAVVVLPAILGILLNPDDPRTVAEFLHERFSDSNLWAFVPQGLLDALPTEPFEAVVAIVIALGALTVIGAAANFLHQFCALTVVARTVTDIRNDLFARLVRLPLASVVERGATDAVSRTIADTESLSQGFNALLSKVLAQVTKGAAAYVGALLIHWQLTLIATLVAPILYVVIRKLGKRIRRASRSAMRGRAGLLRTATEATQGLRAVKVHHTEAHESARFAELNESVLRDQLRVRTARAVASPVIDVLIIFVLGALTMVAFRFIIRGDLSLESFIGALGGLGLAGASLKPVTGLINDIQASSAAADRIHELMGTPIEDDGVRGRPAAPRLARTLAFDGVTFTYPGAETPSVRSVSLEISAGETIAFVGPNGSGKTTLLSLVPRLFDPEQGAVLIDGRDLRELDLLSLREQIGVVTQETVLFKRSIRENVAYGKPEISGEHVWDAIRRARAEEFVKALPDGIDTTLGEQGLTLSGGQRQRLAIARAILRDPAVLILDEATSMIDADSEKAINDAIREFSSGRTSLIVAHRLSTVMNADRIVVMDAGQVADVGTHDELLARCSVYQQLARHQLVAAE